MSGATALARRLALHEARVHAGRRRELVELAFGTLLHDPVDGEPFWNRLVAPRFPNEAGAFDGALATAIVAFGSLERHPHVRPLADGNEPPDLAARLVGAGFAAVGEDRVMLLRDPERVGAHAAESRPAPGRDPDAPTVERIVSRVGMGGRDGRNSGRDPRARGPHPARAATEIALVLAEAFGVDDERRAGIERDVTAALDEPGVGFVLLRVGDEPAAVAKRTSVQGGTYLSSIGTRPVFRGRGLGRLATALAISDGLDAGTTLVHLVVEADNASAITMYRSLGLELVGGPLPDLLLRE